VLDLFQALFEEKGPFCCAETASRVLGKKFAGGFSRKNLQDSQGKSIRFLELRAHN
jgi:hypothetical protein